MKNKHSEYAFKRGMKHLVAKGELEERQDSGKQGNHKMVRRVSPSG